MESNWLSAKQQILGMFFFSAVGGMTIHLPNGGFWLAIYWQSVMSFTHQVWSG